MSKRVRLTIAGLIAAVATTVGVAASMAAGEVGVSAGPVQGCC